MATSVRRGPKKGKRLTIDVQSDIIIETLKSKKTIEDIIAQYKKSGYNFKPDVEKGLKNLETHEIAFMLVNKQVLKSVRDEAISSFIKGITK